MILANLKYGNCYCEEGVDCKDCHLISGGDPCRSGIPKKLSFFCDLADNKTKLDTTSYFECVDGRYRLIRCSENLIFSDHSQECEAVTGHKTQKRSSGSRTGDSLFSVGNFCYSDVF